MAMRLGATNTGQTTVAVRCAVAAVLFCAAIPLHAQSIANGTRIDLTSKLNLNNGTTGQFAQLFVPDYFWPSADDRFTLVFHLHSATWAAENAFYRTGANAILVNIHLGALSSPYQNYFAQSGRFQTVLDTILGVLRSNHIIEQPQIRKLVVSSFSAGYAGVREMMKTHYQQMHALTLADGLHCNSDSSTMRIQMQDFLRFARDASARTRIFLLTHSSITTSGYESTTATSTYLIQNTGLTRAPFSATDTIGTQYSRADSGFFHIKGYLGNTATDHLKHLYGMHLLLRDAMRLLDSTTTDVDREEVAPDGYRLEQNYPNPFNPVTRFAFYLPVRETVSFRIYDITGREVLTLLDEELTEGSHHRDWNASGFASGTYFYQLRSPNFTATRKLQLLR